MNNHDIERALRNLIAEIDWSLYLDLDADDRFEELTDRFVEFAKGEEEWL